VCVETVYSNAGKFYADRRVTRKLMF
jgi:hypothetical protein